VAKKWSLESFTIGPLSHTTNYAFWQDAFQSLPNAPHLKEFTIIYHYPNIKAFDISGWVYFVGLFSRTDIFPPYMRVDIRVTIRSFPLRSKQDQALGNTLYPLKTRRRVTSWGRREWDFLRSVLSISPNYHPRPLVATVGTEAVRGITVPFDMVLCAYSRPFEGGQCS